MLTEAFELLDGLGPVLALAGAVWLFFLQRRSDRAMEERLERRKVFLNFLGTNAALSMSVNSEESVFRDSFARASAAADQVHLVATSSELLAEVDRFREIATKLRHHHESKEDAKFKNDQDQWHKCHESVRKRMRAELLDKTIGKRT